MGRELSGSWSQIQALWGFGWVSCGLGFLGSKLTLPRQQPSKASCYESHIVWLSQGWGGGFLGHWGASNYSPGFNPSSFPAWTPASVLSTLSPPLQLLGSEQVGQGRGSWRP